MNETSLSERAGNQSQLSPVPSASMQAAAATVPSSAQVPYQQPQQPTQQVTNVATTVNVGGPTIVFATNRKKRSFLVRAIWFCCVGFWLSGVFIALGYLLIATIFFAPAGFWFLNRVPQAQTLREKNSDLTVTSKDGITYVTESTAEQYRWYLRLLYLPIGLVLGAIWLSAAWFVSLGIITLPLSVWMIDRAPAVITLEKN